MIYIYIYIYIVINSAMQHIECVNASLVRQAPSTHVFFMMPTLEVLGGFLCMVLYKSN